jgi:hypothetical protein
VVARPDTYRSFGLRFALKKRNETVAAFRARVNAAQEKDGTVAENESDYWLLGPKAIQALRKSFIGGEFGHSLLAIVLNTGKRANE